MGATAKTRSKSSTGVGVLLVVPLARETLFLEEKAGKGVLHHHARLIDQPVAIVTHDPSCLASLDG
jgi:hypothetical protein